MEDRTVCCSIKEPNTEAHEVLVDFVVTQSDMDGLNRLIHWLEGFTAAKGGTIPGAHELTMHYRCIAQNIYRQRDKKSVKNKIPSPHKVSKPFMESITPQITDHGQ